MLLQSLIFSGISIALTPTANAQALAPSDVQFGFAEFLGQINYHNIVIVVADSMEEADAIKRKHFFAGGTMPTFKRVACSSLGTTSGVSWFALVTLNLVDGVAIRPTNGAISCGAKSFDEAARDAYARALQGAKAPVTNIGISAGVSAKVDLATVADRGNYNLSPFAFGCDTGGAQFAGHKSTLPYVPTPTEFPTFLKQNCEKFRFQNIPRGFAAAIPPKF